MYIHLSLFGIFIQDLILVTYNGNTNIKKIYVMITNKNLEKSNQDLVQFIGPLQKCLCIYWPL